MRWVFALIMLASVGPMVGCGEGEAKVDRGDPSSPSYVSDSDPRAFAKHYSGSPLDANPPKKQKKK